MNILCVCRHNSGRSQMAAGFFNALATHYRVKSAGTHAESLIGTPLPEYVVKSMSAVGVDISKYPRTQLTQKMVEEADVVIMITAKEDWPEYVKDSPKVVFWDVAGAKDQPYEFCCNVRDKIKELVDTFDKVYRTKI